MVLRQQDPDLIAWDARHACCDRILRIADWPSLRGGPLVEDEIGVRVAVEHRDIEGFVGNPMRGTGGDALDSMLDRVKLPWTPSALPCPA